LDDVNYQDGTEVEAGSVFLKEWEVQNNGSCDWNEKYRLRFVSGDQMGAPDSVPFHLSLWEVKQAFCRIAGA
jgi:hypothetical protein